MSKLTREMLSEMDLAVEDYICYRVAEGLRKSTVDDMRYRIKRLLRELGVTRFADLREVDVVQWFTALGQPDPDTGKPKISANGRKLQWIYSYHFFRWAIDRKYLDSNPVEHAPKPRKFARDRKKIRRAMTPAELERLVRVAKLRPLAEYVKTRMIGSRHTDYWQANPITWENVEALAGAAEKFPQAKRTVEKQRRDGEKWALTYRCLALLGLRWGELRTLSVGRLELDDERVTLNSLYTKNGNSDVLPVPKELARDLKAWIESEKLGRDDILFQLPGKGVKRFYRDLEVAGIERVNALGKELDIHALRYTYGTMLANAGVSVATAQKLMRHSKPELTIGIYTDADCLNTVGAVESLPAVGSEQPLEAKEEPPAAPASTPAASANDALLKALLENADPETIRKSLLKSLGQ